MLNDGRQFMTTKPMLLFWPGLAIMISVLAFNLFGEGLGEALTPDPEDMALVKEDDAPEAALAAKLAAEEKAEMEAKNKAETLAEAEARIEAESEALGRGGQGPPEEPLAFPKAAVSSASAASPAPSDSPAPILKVRDLRVTFSSGKRLVKALDGVSLDAAPGRITAIVGGSGSGKSVLALSVARLIDKPGRIEGGSIEVEGRDVLALSGQELREHRGRQVAMIFQDPQGSMNPVVKVKKHLFEAARVPRKGRREALGRFKAILARMGLGDPEKVLESYPFELSGGMCQRIMVAMGLVAESRVLIADEPTSNLDLTTQAAILQELTRLKGEGLAIILITHDLGVVAQTADEVYVIHDGRIVESGSAEQVLMSPKMPYTMALVASVQEEAA
jgi:ABC-type dipeptide/oligopeptide/nickel transport system ATPase component